MTTRNFLAVASGCAVVLGLAACSAAPGGVPASGDPSAAPADSPASPTAAADDPGQVAASQGQAGSQQTVPVEATRNKPDETVLGSLRAADSVARDPSGNTDALAEWTTGPLLRELKAQRAELADSKLVAQGDSRVLWTTVTGSGRKAKVTACVDNSGVTFVDDAGVAQPQPGASDPVLNIFTLRRSSDGWIVVSRTFPDNPFCDSEGR